ncbi:trigger factor [Tindallia californiensis]|uniref:Trigger factor n=1 Tax=Tindallia californiensis TaxID=159292 RepID=A0A1H3IIK9_9FIRM|nr:trigger factor [Tindallia californiensis]SDY27109.1 trigger factor [Tindallia californiensis]
MSSEIVKREGNCISLKIVVSPEEFEKAINKAYNKMKSKFNIPGFRKGKAPRKIVEMNYGVEVFYEEAINVSFPEAYEKALEEHSLDPVDQPEVDIEKLEKGEDVIFLADIEIMPDVLVEGYKGVEVEKKIYPVKEEEIEKELKQMQEKNVRMIAIEDRPVQESDTVIFDFEGSIDGEVFEGGKAEKHTLEIGSGQFIPGFEEKMVGLKPGEESVIKVTFPEDYQAEDLAGKEADFKIKIHEVKEKEYPEIDDEFAKDVSEFDTLEELKADIRKKLEEQLEQRTEQELRASVIEKVTEKVSVDIPKAVVERQVNQMLQDFNQQMMSQGIGLDMYYQMTGSNEEDLKEKMRPDAEKTVKDQLVLDKITEIEEIAASDEEIEAEIAKIAEQYNQDVSDFKQKVAQHGNKVFADNVVLRKTIDFLTENATIKEVVENTEDATEEKQAE